MIIFFFKSVQIFMKDLECAETNEKSIFQFLFFELGLIVFIQWHIGLFKFHRPKKNIYRSKVVKLTVKVGNVLKRMKNQFSNF